MGWANCGTDSKGRRIGYAVSAKCDHPGCKARIDRGLGYACGGMHGSSIGCEGYFCGDHLWHRHDPGEGRSEQFCAACCANIDEMARDELTKALLQIYHADPDSEAGSEARAILVRWDELWPDDISPTPTEPTHGR